MALDKVYEIHPTFQEWVRSHRHSSTSVEWFLKEAIEMGPDNPVEVLRSYITNLTELRDEIQGEVSEARHWIKYFRSQKR
jgi:hypothetical protein